jgi:hypothetical protein
VSRFLRALEKVGLVETEARDRAADELPPAETPEPAPDAHAAAPEPEPLPVPAGPIQEQRPFESIYAEAQLAPGPFPAEKLLKILEGLAALEPSARKAAVLALDAADDSWHLDDALLDAERKLKALDGAKRQVEGQARAELERTRTEIEAREQRQQEAVARIRQQITELEALLEREVARATEEKSALQEAARSAKDACTREIARCDAEAARLRRLAEIFATSPAAASPRA